MNAEEGENWSWRRWASAAMLAGVLAAGDGTGVAIEETLSFPPETSVGVDVDVEEVPLTFACGRRVPERGEVEELRVDAEVEEVDVALAARGGVRFVANQR
jgi:hypothetical protein